MATQSLTATEHYAASLRLLAVAEGAHEPAADRAVAATAAIAHATLAGLPRRARRVERPARHASNGLPDHLTWGDEGHES